MNEVEVLTGLIALRTTIDTLDGLSQNQDFTDEEKETLADAKETIESWMERVQQESDEEES